MNGQAKRAAIATRTNGKAAKTPPSPAADQGRGRGRLKEEDLLGFIKGSAGRTRAEAAEHFGFSGPGMAKRLDGLVDRELLARGGDKRYRITVPQG